MGAGSRMRYGRVHAVPTASAVVSHKISIDSIELMLLKNFKPFNQSSESLNNTFVNFD